MSQTIEQQRAAYAMRMVKERLDDPDKKRKEFKSYAHQFPAMIRMNGLGQAAAFYRSKGTDDTHYQLYKLVSDWLGKSGQPYVEKDLMDGITSKGLDSYLLAQTEALALLSWVKKFASAFIEDPSKTANPEVDEQNDNGGDDEVST